MTNATPMIVGCLSQSIKNTGRVRVPSSPIDMLARHLEHVTTADPLSDLLDLPTLAEVLDTFARPTQPPRGGGPADGGGAARD